ncbi:lycopene cyclase domain-containing protein [Arthrobacter sp. HLT1-21]
MTYGTLNAIFLVPVLIAAVLAVVRSRRRTGRTGRTGAGTGIWAGTGTGAPGGAVSWRAVGLCAVILLTLTAVFDNLMIQLGFFGYNPYRISGVFVGLAPVEDFAYTVAAAVLLPALWSLFTPPAVSSSAGPSPAERSSR